jgi:hypothetical protein
MLPTGRDLRGILPIERGLLVADRFFWNKGQLDANVLPVDAGMQ